MESSQKRERNSNQMSEMAAFVNMREIDESPAVKKIRTISEVHATLNDGKPVAVDVEPGTKHDGGDGKVERPKLSALEYKKLKTMLQERKRILKKLPRLTLEEAGKNASLDVPESLRAPLDVMAIRNFLVSSHLGHNSSAYNCTKRWCRLEKFTEISNTTVIVVQGFTRNHFIEFREELSFLDISFEYKLEIGSPVLYGRTLIEVLSNMPISSTHMHKLITEYGNLETAVEKCSEVYRHVFPVFPIKDKKREKKATTLPKDDTFSRTELLLSPMQLFMEHYPLCMGLTPHARYWYANFVLTKELYDPVTAHSPMFSVDCEMCSTVVNKAELTRVSVVNEDLEVVYETLVKPDNEITDYVTPYSGITQELLEGVTTRLEDVQIALQGLLPRDAILIGQSLNYDLLALKLIHPYVIDTSVIYNTAGVRRVKTKLSTLSKLHLGKEIQQSKSGHCPIEDSRAAMQLVKLKLLRGMDFGDSVPAQPEIKKSKNKGNEIGMTDESSKSQEAYRLVTNIFSHLARDKQAAVIGSTKVIEEYSKYLQPYLLHSDKDGQKNGVKLINAESDEDLITQTCRAVPQTATVISHMEVPLNSKTLVDGRTCKIVNDNLKQIWDLVPFKGLCVIVFDGNCLEDENGTNNANSALFIKFKTLRK